MYCTDDVGVVICTMAYGSDVRRVPPLSSMGAPFDCGHGQGRAAGRYGQERQMSGHVSQPCTLTLRHRSYEQHDGLQDFASWSTVAQVAMGELVSLPLKVYHVEEREPRRKGESHAWRFRALTSRPRREFFLRWWMDDRHDISVGGVYICWWSQSLHRECLGRSTV